MQQHSCLGMSAVYECMIMARVCRPGSAKAQPTYEESQWPSPSYQSCGQTVMRGLSVLQQCQDIAIQATLFSITLTFNQY